MPAEFATCAFSYSNLHQPWSAAPVIRLGSELLAQRLGRTLLLLPHYDDECAAGALIRQLPEATVLFLTDGAPRDRYFWERYGSREHYSALRKRESVETLGAAGISRVLSLDDISGLPAPTDQELYRALPDALHAVHSLAKSFQPKTILAPAFEGGHPDHDAASFLAAHVARRLEAEHWELPYYHRAPDGSLQQQEFLEHFAASVEITIDLTDSEVQQKRLMWSRYQSQCAVLQQFQVEKEIYRRAPNYEWQRPPHPGTLNYEAWRWSAKGSELSAAFRSALALIA